jgi:hypothetical protein
MARDGQVLPPLPAPGRNTLCTIVLLSISSPELSRNSRPRQSLGLFLPRP